MTVEATWGEVLEWATREIETARTGLETVTAADLPALQARIVVMRGLIAMNELPAKPELPPQISYTDR